jgi:hypothetical protein
VQYNDERAAIIREIAKKKVVVHLPGMDNVPRRSDLRYRAASGTDLSLEIFLPPNVQQQHPLVVLPMAYPDPDAGVREFGPLTSWARLMAASGMAAMVYGTEAPADDVHAVLRHVRAHANALGIDASRIGVFAASGNVTVALAALMLDRGIRCAALLCGYTLDLDGSIVVADVAKQFGFADACVGRTPDELPQDAPLLFVRAGLDASPGLNAALDEVIRRSLARNLPLWVINHPMGAHGFEVDEATDLSRGIVRHVLSFLQLHLGLLPIHADRQ